jgi:hypothetical protein
VIEIPASGLGTVEIAEPTENIELEIALPPPLARLPYLQLPLHQFQFHALNPQRVFFVD